MKFSGDINFNYNYNFNFKLLVISLLASGIFTLSASALCAQENAGAAAGKGASDTAEVTAAGGQKPLSADEVKSKEIKIKWSSKYSDALSEAQKDKKPVLIFAYATWCGWCKKMERETCADKDIVKLTESFVCIKINSEEEEDFFAKFKVKEFPSVVFLNSDGTEIERHIGFKTVDEFEKTLQNILETVKNPQGK